MTTAVRTSTNPTCIALEGTMTDECGIARKWLWPN
jgi:hypothetical protein